MTMAGRPRRAASWWATGRAIARALRNRGAGSWQIHIQHWEQHLDTALWLRAAERIDVGPGGVVPGALEIDPLPEPTVTPARAGELAESWRGWWQTLVTLPPRVPDQLPAESAFYPPDFAGMAPWPDLREVLRQRWTEADEWHSARKRAGMDQHVPPRQLEGRIVQEAERALRAPLAPFALEFVLLPVRDEEIRQVSEGRFLVPERIFYDEPRWTPWLRQLITRIGSQPAAS
jgi:hypothetical protein